MDLTPASPSLISLPHPLQPDGKDISYAPFLPGETLGAYIERTGVQIARGPVHVWHNGRPVPDALWTRLIPRTGDMIVVRGVPQGGGGGGKILRTVAMIALVVASITIPGAGITGLYSGFGLTGTSLALASAGIMIGGSLLINALIPPPKPTSAQLGTGSKYESSPTYSIAGGRNRARPWEPMILVFGRHRVVPDLASTPYTQFSGADQYPNQAFHLGLQGSAVSFSDIRIGDTPISNYEGVQVQRSAADGKLSLVAGNVDTIQGFALSQAGGWQTRRTADNVGTIAVELAARLFRINDNGTYASRQVDVRVQYRRVGSSDWIEQGTIGAVYATHYWSVRDRRDETVQLEFGSLNAGDHDDGDPWYGQDDDGSMVFLGRWRWVPHPYQLGQPWEGIAPDPLITPGALGVRISGRSQEPVRRTVKWSVPRGQYEVRVLKVSADINDSRESNEVVVNQILAFQADDANYSGQARLAVRIKATGQLNGQIDELNLLVIARCPVWNGSQWVTQETSNPAWWYRWFAHGLRLSTGERVYGGGLPYAQIDTDAIIAWAAWCDEKRLTFDWVLDRKMSAAEVLQIIARAGRASPTWQSGRLGVVWDAANLPIVAMFGPFNVRAGSFEVAYVNDGTVDEIVLNFTNAARNYQMDEVRVSVPGATASNNPLQLDLDGCTNAAMAGREANLLAASQVWHRRRITWETDIEGYVATRGDVVSFSHDLTVWGYSGRLMPGSHGAGESGELPLMVLDSAVPSDGSGTVLLRGPEGQMKTVSVTSTVGEVTQLTITTDLDGFPMPGDPGYEDAQPLDWAWQFDPLATPGRRFKIVSVEPVADGVRFQAIDDDPQYYASENNPYRYEPPRDGSLLAGVVFSVFTAEQIVSVSADQIRLSFDWVLSRDMPALVVATVNGQRRLSQVFSERSAEIMVSTGDTVTITVTPRSSTGAGTPKTVTVVVQGLGAPLPPVTGLTSVFRDGLTVLSWQRVVDIRQPRYEVRLGPTWGNAQTVAVTDAVEQLAVGNGLYWVAARFQLADGTIIYGEPDSLLIAGAVLVRNVIVQRDEAPTWPGTVSGGAYVYDGALTLAPQGDILAVPDILAEQDVLWYGGPADSGLYTIAESDRVDVGYVTPVRVDLHFDVTTRNISADILEAPDVFDLEDVLNGSDRQYVTVTPQIRHAQVDGAWSDWRDYVPGLINARFFDVRLLIATDDPLIIPYVTAFSWSIDVPDLLQRGEGVLISAGGVRITYGKAFHAVPNVQITILDAVDGDRAVLTDSNETGFDIEVFNGSTSVEREINWLAQGY